MFLNFYGVNLYVTIISTDHNLNLNSIILTQITKWALSHIILGANHKMESYNTWLKSQNGVIQYLAQITKWSHIILGSNHKMESFNTWFKSQNGVIQYLAQITKWSFSHTIFGTNHKRESKSYNIWHKSQNWA